MPEDGVEKILFAINLPPEQHAEADYDRFMELAEMTAHGQLPVNDDGSVHVEFVSSCRLPLDFEVAGSDGVALEQCELVLSWFDVEETLRDDETYCAGLDTDYFFDRYAGRIQPGKAPVVHERRLDWYGARGTNQHCSHLNFENHEC